VEADEIAKRRRLQGRLRTADLSRDYATAMRFLRPLADQGNVVAQLLLGQMNESGEGVAQDFVRAHVWYNLAASGSSDNSGQQRSAVEDRDAEQREHDEKASKESFDPLLHVRPRIEGAQIIQRNAGVFGLLMALSVSASVRAAACRARARWR